MLTLLMIVQRLTVLILEGSLETACLVSATDPKSALEHSREETVEVLVEAHDHSARERSGEADTRVVSEAESRGLSGLEALPRLLECTLIHSQHPCKCRQPLLLRPEYQDPSVYSRFEPPGSDERHGQSLVEHIVGRVSCPVLPLSHLSQ
jgi:hypothetical protein